MLGEHVTAGRLGGAARQAALRLHARAGAHGRGARGGRAARQRGDLREPAGAHRSRRRSTRRGKLGAMMLFGEKYGDDRARRRGRGLLARALRRHARAHRPRRSGRSSILSEGSVGSGARRIEAVTSGEAWALLHARAREADELRAELERGCARSRSASRVAAERVADRRAGGPRRRRRERHRPAGRRPRRRRAARALRPLQAAARAGGGRARRRATTGRCISSRTSTSRSPSGSSALDVRQGGRGDRRRRRRRAADDGARRRQGSREASPTRSPRPSGSSSRARCEGARARLRLRAHRRRRLRPDRHARAARSASSSAAASEAGLARLAELVARARAPSASSSGCR